MPYLLPLFCDLVLNLDEDNLRVYPLDAASKQRTKVFGSPRPYEPPDFVIL